MPLGIAVNRPSPGVRWRVLRSRWHTAQESHLRSNAYTFLGPVFEFSNPAACASFSGTGLTQDVQSVRLRSLG